MIDCSYSTPEELTKILKQIPTGKEVLVTKGRRGVINFSKTLPKGKLTKHTEHGSYNASFFWTDGKYCEYVWLSPRWDRHLTDPILLIEVL